MSGAMLLAALAVAGCEQGAATQAPPAAAAQAESERARDMTEAERLLEQRSAAMQRTILEATGTGVVVGGVPGIGFGIGPRALIGSLAGAVAGASAGSYVAEIQQGYATDEQRLNRMIADLDVANADAAAVLEAMRAVLAEQTAEIASIRAAIAADASAQAVLETELDSLQENVETMQAAISGADQRLADARAARGVVQSEQAVATVDPRLGELSRRIAAMREIATTLAQGA